MKSKKTILISFVALLIISIIGLGFIFIQNNVPNGWFKAGNSPNSYEIGTEQNAGQKGENVVYIKSIEKNIKGFGTLMQSFSAEKYLNKRVRFSGDIKSENVAESAGLWMRIDGKGSPIKTLEFDNMNNRPIKGTTNWKKYSVVLDVPDPSNMINIGFLLSGTGEIWVKNLKFEEVNKNVPTTDLMSEAQNKKEPVNLNFK